MIGVINMKKVFNLISLLLVTGMIFCSCTGCGGGQSGKDSKHQFDKNDGPLVPYEETLKVKQVRYQNTSVTYARGEDKSDNFIRDFFKCLCVAGMDVFYFFDPKRSYPFS